MSDFSKILIANRGEIAIRIMRAANEMGKKTVAVFAEEDKLGLHRFKADEAYRIGHGLGPVAAYLSIDEIIRVAKQSGADAIHPRLWPACRKIPTLSMLATPASALSDRKPPPCARSGTRPPRAKWRLRGRSGHPGHRSSGR